MLWYKQFYNASYEWFFLQQRSFNLYNLYSFELILIKYRAQLAIFLMSNWQVCNTCRQSICPTRLCCQNFISPGPACERVIRGKRTVLIGTWPVGNRTHNHWKGLPPPSPHRRPPYRIDVAAIIGENKYPAINYSSTLLLLLAFQWREHYLLCLLGDIYYQQPCLWGLLAKIEKV